MAAKLSYFPRKASLVKVTLVKTGALKMSEITCRMVEFLDPPPVTNTLVFESRQERKNLPILLLCLVMLIDDKA